jgi:SAM-dependent methyltransferase
MTAPLKFWESKHGTYATKAFVRRPNFFAQEIAGLVPPGARLLELGCGQGADALFFAGQGAQVTACDFSRFALDQFAKDAEAAGVREVELDLSDVPYPFDDDSFDIVYAHLSLHYFDTASTWRVLADIRRILRPGGRLLATFNSVRDPEVGEGIELGEPTYRELGPGDRKRYFSVDELAGLLGAGFTVLDAGYSRGTAKNPDDEFVRLVATTDDVPQAHVLGEPGSDDANCFGGKAATLSRLRAAGFRVPDGAVLAADAYLRHVRDVAGKRPVDWSFGEWSATVRAAILAAPLPDTVLADLGRTAESLDSGSGIIVRSSAVGEDSAAHSFAGQLDSVSDVSAVTLGDAVRSVWASAWGTRAVTYREHRGLEAIEDLPVAVLIQPFIEPDLAGVHFTTAPTTGAGESVIEAVRGRGEGLVSGSAESVRYWLSSDGTVVQADGKRDELLDSVAGELHAVGRRLAETLGGPQDIEWVVKDGEMTIVQSRPITTGTARAAETFYGRVTPIAAGRETELPAELAEKDKFKLRLLATRAGVAISRGWWLSLGIEQPDDGAEPPELADRIVREVERFSQVSIVLQRPGRLGGEIVRRFSPTENLAENLSEVVARVGVQAPEFDLIVTEIYMAEKSGISHIVDGRLVIEVAYGSYVPKGVVPTALYVAGDDGVRLMRSPVQDEGIFIEAGQPVHRPVGKAATLSGDQINVIGRMTEVVGGAYPDVSVEFGVLADGTPYLIDIIPDMSPVALDDVRVMSAGRIRGVARVVDSADYAARSLDAHFHSDRGADASDLPPTVIAAPSPFLALEDHLGRHGVANVGFIFEHGSLLGHLAIILREHGVPAIVVPGIRERVSDGDVITVDTSSEELFRIESAAEVP